MQMGVVSITPMAAAGGTYAPPPAAVMPTLAERVRVVASGLDVLETDRVTCDEIDALLRRLGIPLSQELLGYLSAALDAEGKLVMGFDSLMVLGETFPALLDSMYFRSRDLEEDAKQRDEINRELGVLADLHSQQDHLHAQIERTAFSINSAEAALAQARQGVQRAVEKEARAQEGVEAALHHVSGRSREARERKEGLIRQRGEMRQVVHALDTAKADAREIEEDLRVAVRDVESAVLNVRGLERQLQQAQEALRAKELAAEGLEEKLRHAQHRQRDLEDDYTKHRAPIESIQDDLQHLEDSVSAGVADRSRAESAAALAARELERHRASKDEAEHGVREAKGKVDALQDDMERLQHELAEQERKVNGMEARNRDWRLERKQVLEEDFVLLEQELLLRHERRTVEAEERYFRKSVKGIARTSASHARDHAPVPPADAPVPLVVGSTPAASRGPSPLALVDATPAQSKHCSPERHDSSRAAAWDVPAAPPAEFKERRSAERQDASRWDVPAAPVEPTLAVMPPAPLVEMPAAGVKQAAAQPPLLPLYHPSPGPNLDERIEIERQRLLQHRQEHLTKISASPSLQGGEGALPAPDPAAVPLDPQGALYRFPLTPSAPRHGAASIDLLARTSVYEATAAPMMFPVAAPAPATDLREAARAAKSEACLAAATATAAEARAAAVMAKSPSAKGQAALQTEGTLASSSSTSTSGAPSAGGRKAKRPLTSPPSPHNDRTAPPPVSFGPSKYQTALSERRQLREAERYARKEAAAKASQRRPPGPARLGDAPCYLRDYQ